MGKSKRVKRPQASKRTRYVENVRGVQVQRPKREQEQDYTPWQ